MKDEQLIQGNEIQKKIRYIKDNLEKIDKAIKYMKGEGVDHEKNNNKDFHVIVNSKWNDTEKIHVDRTSSLEFMYLEKMRNEEKMKELQKEFELI